MDKNFTLETAEIAQAFILLANRTRRRIMSWFRSTSAETLSAVYPDRVGAYNLAALTMLLFGMIDSTFIRLKPGSGIDGKLSYADFAALVETVLTSGIAGMPAQN